MSGTGEGTLGVFWDVLGDPRGGPGRVKGPFWRSGTGWRTLPEVRDGLRDPPGGPG